MSFKFGLQKTPDLRPVPSLRVRKAGVERQVPFVVRRSCEPLCIGTIDRHIEDGKIQKIDKLFVADRKIERIPGLIQGFRGGPEKKIYVSPYACF